ncbi:MAG: hypothetical protein IPG42_04755 [Betaproteobacteria bacterium]|nr:hypothetical protein [Betaproteobacteria bacterium]
MQGTIKIMLHGIGPEKSVPVVVGDALEADTGECFEVVQVSPPLGKKSSTVIVDEDGCTSTEKDAVERDDFWATTSNKQLNFAWHIKTLQEAAAQARCAHDVAPAHWLVLSPGCEGQCIVP